MNRHAENDKVYYVSQYDNKIHNIYDNEYIFAENDKIYNAYVGKNCGDDGFRVDEEVTLYTLKEIIEFFK